MEFDALGRRQRRRESTHQHCIYIALKACADGLPYTLFRVTAPAGPAAGEEKAR
jgi:hypothetical protein